MDTLMPGPTPHQVNVLAAIKSIEIRIERGLPIFDAWLIDRCISSEVKPLWPNGITPKS